MTRHDEKTSAWSHANVNVSTTVIIRLDDQSRAISSSFLRNSQLIDVRILLRSEEEENAKPVN
jgi:hypothetical protein